MNRLSRTIAALPVLLALAAPASAAAQPRLYEGEVRVTSQDPGERVAMLPQALEQVFVKLTGDPAAARHPGLARRLADAQSLLQQYRYRQEVDTVDGQPVTRLYLIARFSPAGVDAIFADAGIAVWPEPRPEPLVWLAIDDGSGPRLVSAGDAAAVAALTARAADRGVGLQFPLLDVEDQRTIGVQQVWTLDRDAVVAASRRYRAPTVLVGRLQRSGDEWRSFWALLDGGASVAEFAIADPDPRAVLAAAGDSAVDRLAAYYTDPAVLGAAGHYLVAVDGLGGVADYAAVVERIRALGIVRAARVVAARPERLTLDVDLATGLEGLGRALAGDSLLALAEAPGEPGIDARIQLRR